MVPGSSCMSAHGSPVVFSRSGTVRMVKSFGSASPARPSRSGTTPWRWQGARAVGAGDGAVAVGLVEVDEDAVAAFLLPPGGGDLLGHPPLEFAGGRDDGVAHVQEFLGRLDRGKDVQPAVAGGLDEGLQPGLREYAPQLAWRPERPRRTRYRAAGRGRSATRPDCPDCRPGRARGGRPPYSSAPPTPRRRFRQ